MTYTRCTDERTQLEQLLPQPGSITGWSRDMIALLLSGIHKGVISEADAARKWGISQQTIVRWRSAGAYRVPTQPPRIEPARAQSQAVLPPSTDPWAGLPRPDVYRFNLGHKKKILDALGRNAIDEDEVLARYGISRQTLDEWEQQVCASAQSATSHITRRDGFVLNTRTRLLTEDSSAKSRGQRRKREQLVKPTELRLPPYFVRVLEQMMRSNDALSYEDLKELIYGISRDCISMLDVCVTVPKYMKHLQEMLETKFPQIQIVSANRGYKWSVAR